MLKIIAISLCSMVSFACFSQKTTYAWNPHIHHFQATKLGSLSESYEMHSQLKIQGLQDKVPGTNMRNLGRALTFPGILLLGAGIAIISTTEVHHIQFSSNSQTGTTESGDIVGAIGIDLVVFGTAMTTAGIVLWTKGARKMKRNKEITTD